MKNLIYEEKSECCKAYVTLNLDDPIPGERDIYYFKCAKCGKNCHLKLGRK